MKRLLSVRNSRKSSLGKENSVNKDMAMWGHVVHFDVAIQYSVIIENAVRQSQFPNPEQDPTIISYSVV